MPPIPVSHIAVIDKSALSDREVALTMEGYRAELSAFCTAWGVPTPGLAVYGKGHSQQIQEEAALFFVDSANQPDAYGYHTAMGVARFGYIDVGICRAYGEPVSRVFGHELFELIADPDCDRWAGPYADRGHIAIEVCDPVQRFSEATEVVALLFGASELVEIADYVLPSWFDPSSAGPWSAQGNVSAPLEVAAGGYVIRESNGHRVSDGARVKSFGRTFRRLATPRK